MRILSESPGRTSGYGDMLVISCAPAMRWQVVASPDVYGPASLEYAAAKSKRTFHKHSGKYVLMSEAFL